MATSTFLSYTLTLALRGRDRADSLAPLRIIHEELYSIKAQVAPEDLGFPYDPAWFESAIHDNQGQSEFFFGIQGETAGRLKWATVDDGQGGSRRELFVDSPLPRTLLSSSTEGRKPTVALAQQEMRSWRVLYLEPLAMRTPDDTAALLGPTQLGNDGSNLAATLYSVAHAPLANGQEPEQRAASTYAGVRNRLLSLLYEVRDITVERDDEREELTLSIKGRDGTWHSARALSDGSLRFLALAVLEAQEKPEVLCIEEPENGIHPGRIPALLDLLQGIAMDTSYPVEEGNPLRQVIISTHSPSVVMRVPADSLVVAELRDTVREGQHFNRASFSGLANTWRDPVPSRKSLALGTLLTYLNPEGYRPLPRPDPDRDPDAEPRIMDRPDIRDLLTPLPKLDG